MKIIAITGTPGVGKTEVSRLLSKELNAKLISISYIIRKYKVKYNLDKKRKTKIIDIKDLKIAVNKESIGSKIVIIDGHLSHFLETSMIFVLRCDPFVLKKRLIKRKWPLKKINENTLSEVLDIIASESKNTKKPVYQIDTTGKKSIDVVKNIQKILNNPKKYKENNYNWLESHKKLVSKLDY